MTHVSAAVTQAGFHECLIPILVVFQLIMYSKCKEKRWVFSAINCPQKWKRCWTTRFMQQHAQIIAVFINREHGVHSAKCTLLFKTLLFKPVTTATSIKLTSLCLFVGSRWYMEQAKFAKQPLSCLYRSRSEIWLHHLNQCFAEQKQLNRYIFSYLQIYLTDPTLLQDSTFISVSNVFEIIGKYGTIHLLFTSTRCLCTLIFDIDLPSAGVR